MGTSQKQRILIVDDDEEIARLVWNYLTQAGYEVTAVFDPEQLFSNH